MSNNGNNALWTELQPKVFKEAYIVFRLLTEQLPIPSTGPPGPPGETGVGVPAGGTAGQVLTKNSSANYDDSWQTPAAGIVVANTPFTLPNAGAYTLAHGLGYSPSFAVIAVGSDGTSLIGIVGWQLPPLQAAAWDAANFYLYGSDSGIKGFVLSIQ